MTAAVHIASVGARTAVGPDATQSAMAALANIVGAREHDYWVDKSGHAIILAHDRLLSTVMPLFDRLFELAVDAILQALQPVLMLDHNTADIVVFLGLPSTARPGIDKPKLKALVQRIIDALDKQITVTEVQLIYHGHAAGLEALHDARQYIAQNPASLCLAGGVDSYIDIETLEWLDTYDRLHSLSTTWGIIPGEATAFCLLGAEEAFEHYRLPAIAQLNASAIAYEENQIYTNDVCLGRGLTTAFQAVLSDIDPAQCKVNEIYCDLNGERYRADEYGFTVLRTDRWFDCAEQFHAPVRSVGEIGAATGPLSVALASYSAANGYANGPLSLIWGSSNSGQRAAVLLTTPDSISKAV